MSKFHNCRECITEVACEKAGRCFNGSSAGSTSAIAAPSGSLSCDAMVSCGPHIFEAIRNTQLVEGADGFLQWWGAQEPDAKDWWLKAQAEYERLAANVDDEPRRT